MHATALRTMRILTAAAVLPLGAWLAGGGTTAQAAAARRAPDAGAKRSVFHVTRILSGTMLEHSFTPKGGGKRRTEKLADPDDITRLGQQLFVGFQNGVGPEGEPSVDGNTRSTVVELTESGRVVAQWDITGKCDGLTAYPQEGSVIATVNEDANSSLYLIDPSASRRGQVTHYRYSAPLPHHGGTDAISDYRGQLLISASAPGTTGRPAPQRSYPAVYTVTLDPYDRLATAAPLFYDEATATIANLGRRHGRSDPLALTDPDSSEVVPMSRGRFGGDFVLDSQGDRQQIYVRDAGRFDERLSVLALSQSIDDTAWPTQTVGRLFSTDSSNDAVDVVTGHFRAGQAFAVATPCGANGAPATCPAPPKYPANFLASLDLWTGKLAHVAVDGVAYVPQGGLAFVPGR